MPYCLEDEKFMVSFQSVDGSDRCLVLMSSRDIVNSKYEGGDWCNGEGRGRVGGKGRQNRIGMVIEK